MYVLVTYDVCTKRGGGARRLRRVAKACESRGQRVQCSVFECSMDPATWVSFKAQLLDLIDPESDSLRFYLLGNNWRKRVEHHGAKPSYDVEGPLIV
ncbi:MAG: CRISPR-associated endonuclease Cas2 [Planctomycetota bacterium]|jgi:CRISPR-associated protein Cas2|nr:CRISPR-associated endonuclease Cas2 [Planctomycetota bacterium]